MSKLRIGAIPFLNAKPIVFGLEMGMGEDRMELRFSAPEKCARLISEGELDLALLPSIEYARTEGLHIVPEICVASRGEVASVLLLSNVEVAEISTIALDNRSRTSVALLKILCRELYKINPEFITAEPKPREMLKSSDAALIIGDAALYFSEETPVRRDLGADWAELTGLPFVYAFWAGRGDAAGRREVRLLQCSLREGKAGIPKIAANYPNKGGNSELNERYLRAHIHYDLGEDELTGLKLFYIKAWEHRLIEGVPRLRFYEG